jgi:hypothetical protein
MTDRDDPGSSPNRPNGRLPTEAPSELDARSRRSAAAEGLSAIEDALLPTGNRESPRARENVTPLPRPAQRTQLRPKQEPLTAQPRPKQESPPPPRPKQELRPPPQPRPKQELPPPPPQPRAKQELPPPPAPRPTQKPRAVQGPETVEEHVAARPARPPQAPIHRSDYRAPQAQEPGFLGAVVAIVSMVAVLVGLAVAYFLLRKH